MSDSGKMLGAIWSSLVPAAETDLDVIRERHYPISSISDHLGTRTIEPECAFEDCKQRWPCDTAVVLAALDEARQA